MKPGVEIDIITGRPSGLVADEQTRDREIKEKALLEEKAAFSEVVRSDAGIKVIELLRSELQKRIEFLLAQDPWAKGILQIIATFGVGNNEAARATQALMDRYLKSDR